MRPVTPQQGDFSHLHPDSAYGAYSGHSSRRSSVSMSGAGGRNNSHSQFSGPSIMLTPTSQTSESIHQSVLGDSFLSDTSAIPDPNSSYQWGITSGIDTADLDTRFTADNQVLFPPQDSVAPSPNPPHNDDVLNPNLLSNDSDLLFRSILREIEFDYNHHPNRPSYVSILANFVSSNRTEGNHPDPEAEPTTPSSARRGSFICLICTSSRPMGPGTFQRHVNEQHHAKSYYNCPLCDGYRNLRKDRFRIHLLRKHGQNFSNQQIKRCEFKEPIPQYCDICVLQGLDLHPGPFSSWDSWYGATKSHCRLQAPAPPSPAHSQNFRDFDGDGAGGYGGATGHGSAFQGEGSGGASSFLGSDLGMGNSWSGVPFYGRTVSRKTTPIDASADQSNKPTQASISNDFKNDIDRNQNDRQMSRDPTTSQRARDNKDTDVNKERCNRCNHVYDSCCAACPQKYVPGYCHLCQGPTVSLPISKKSFITPSDANQKSQPRERAKGKAPPLETLVHGLSKLSLDCQRMIPKSDITNKKSVSSFSTSSKQSHTVSSAQPRSYMTVEFSPAMGNEFNPMCCLVISISQLSLKSRYMSQLMTMDDNPKVNFDALKTGQKMLKNIHENPPSSSEKLVKQITCCQTALHAIGSEISASSQDSASQKARQKRLSSLWARLRAVTFVLALQKEVVADETQEKRPLADNTPSTLLDTIGKRISPLAELCSLYKLVHKHLYGDFWTSSGLLEEVINQDVKSPVIEDVSGLFTFLRALVARLSDPQQFFLKEYAASEFSALVENVF